MDSQDIPFKQCEDDTVRIKQKDGISIKQEDNEDSINVTGKENHKIEIKEETDTFFFNTGIEETNTRDINDSKMNIEWNQTPNIIVKEEDEIPFVSIGIEDYATCSKQANDSMEDVKEMKFLVHEEAENVSSIAPFCELIF